jgi:hypothetical protein
MKPELSVIMITPDAGTALRGTMKHLQRQSAKELLEIIVVCPDPETFKIEGFQPQELAGFQALQGDVETSFTAARAAGIRAAKAPVVVLTEDHSFPEPEWAEALIRRHREGYAVVGPVVVNGNPSSLVSWANYLIEYSQWMSPADDESIGHLPGHNSAYKRECLLAYGDRLETLLASETVLHWDLQKSGQRLSVEPAARLHHFNFSRLIPSLALRFAVGRLFGGQRCVSWPAFKRLAYAFGSPLIPLIRLLRITGHIKRSESVDGLPRGLFPILFLLLIVDAAGELTGYAFGPGATEKTLTAIDFHRERFMNIPDQEQFIQIQNGGSFCS